MAPVALAFDYAEDDLALLAAHDSDSFNRWEAGQRLAMQVILQAVTAVRAGHAPRADRLDPRLLELAEALPFARTVVNSGRLSLPCTYDGSRLNGADHTAMPARTRRVPAASVKARW